MDKTGSNYRSASHKRVRIFLTHTEQEFDDYYSVSGLHMLEQHAEVVRNRAGRVLAGAELAHAAAGCQIIIAHRSAPGNAATFDHAPELVAFLRGAVDISTIDVAAASAHGVLITRATAGFADAVAEMALGMMIDLSRGISRAAVAYRSGEAPALVRGTQLTKATLGLIGYGLIGRRLAEIGAALGMHVVVFDPYAPSVQRGQRVDSLRQLLAASDFVVCLAASTPQTANLMDAAAFASMRRGACFLNLSRGELVDEDALEAALDSGHLRGAGLDVGRAPDQKPSPRFLGRADVVAMPHAAGMTREATEHQAMDTVRQAIALVQGSLPEGAVNADAAYRLERLRV